ncbi:hypothetical protein NKJ06_21145 [Mesorhizobium sp. M0293]|uniref:hypothetical protein n=1 Tax=Mesorhizobium sp. M0293 TaxID=2956930 RepID=UPI00333CF7D1
MTLNETEDIARALREKAARTQDKDGLLRDAAEAIDWLLAELEEAERDLEMMEWADDDEPEVKEP